jgi:hypothetical protein
LLQIIVDKASETELYLCTFCYINNKFLYTRWKDQTEMQLENVRITALLGVGIQRISTVYIET